MRPITPHLSKTNNPLIRIRPGFQLEAAFVVSRQWQGWASFWSRGVLYPPLSVK